MREASGRELVVKTDGASGPGVVFEQPAAEALDDLPPPRVVGTFYPGNFHRGRLVVERVAVGNVTA